MNFTQCAISGCCPSSDADLGQGLLERQLGAEDDPVGLLHPADLLLGEAGPLQADRLMPTTSARAPATMR